MSSDLVKRMRATESEFMAAVADRIEALEGEVARLNIQAEAERKLRMEAHPLTIAQRENEKLRAALEPFARFAEMFEAERKKYMPTIPTEHDAEWYQRDTQGGTFVLRVGMFYDAKKAMEK